MARGKGAGGRGGSRGQRGLHTRPPPPVSQPAIPDLTTRWRREPCSGWEGGRVNSGPRPGHWGSLSPPGLSRDTVWAQEPSMGLEDGRLPPTLQGLSLAGPSAWGLLEVGPRAP